LDGVVGIMVRLGKNSHIGRASSYGFACEIRLYGKKANHNPFVRTTNRSESRAAPWSLVEGEESLWGDLGGHGGKCMPCGHFHTD